MHGADGDIRRRKMSEWIKIEDQKPLENTEVLAIYQSIPGVMYNCCARGWFMDTIYSCRYEYDRFIIQSHGPYIDPTHWMPLPKEPDAEKDS